MRSNNEEYIQNLLHEESPWLSAKNIDWSNLTVSITPKLFRKYSIIYHQNEPSSFVYIVKNGRVNISIVNYNGDEKSLFIADKNCIFGEISCFTNNYNCAQAMVVSDALIYVISKNIFIKKIQEDSKLALNVMSLHSKKINLLTSQIEQMAFCDSIFRVVKSLLFLIDNYGVEVPNGIQINMHFTQQELGNLISVSRVTVSNIINSLIRENIIEKWGKNIVIKDIERLKKYSVKN